MTQLFEGAETGALLLNELERYIRRFAVLTPEQSELLVHRPWKTERVRAAALVRKIAKSKPTLLLDESDTAFAGDIDSH